MRRCISGQIPHSGTKSRLLAALAVFSLKAAERAPKGYWKDPSNLRKFFDELARGLGFSNLNGWYKVSRKQVAELGGGTVLSHHNGSLITALLNAYPEYNWEVSKFENLPQNYWSVKANRRKFFDDYAVKNQISQPNGWYKVKANEIRKDGGSGVIDRIYEGSLQHALSDVYPEVTWNPELFLRTPRNFWKEKENIRGFFQKFAEDNNIVFPEGWYDVSSADIIKAGGASVIKAEGVKSLRSALVKQFPEHDWKVWMFNPVPRGFWDKSEHVSQYMAWISDKLGIVNLDDWYKVSYEQVTRLRGVALLQRYGGLYGLLKSIYPTHNWKPENFVPTIQIKKNQKILVSLLSELFPGIEILEDYRHPLLKFTESGYGMELDVFLPSLDLAFEYQGQHHYRDHFLFGPVGEHRQRDIQKAHACEKARIKLIEIPYWWDKSKESLVATIRKHRSDLLSQHKMSVPISPLEPSSMSSKSLMQGTARVKALNLDGSLTCVHVNGAEFKCEIGDLPSPPIIGSSIAFRFSGVLNEGRPTSARAISIVETGFVPKQGAQNPWYLARGRQQGRVPNCKGCGVPFANRRELRVCVNASHIPGRTDTPFNATYSFHINPKCIESAVLGDRDSVYPPFNRKIAVLGDLASEIPALCLNHTLEFVANE